MYRRYINKFIIYLSIYNGLSVPLSHLLTTACHCCRFAAVGPAGRRYRSIAFTAAAAARPSAAVASSATSSSDVGSWQRGFVVRCPCNRLVPEVSPSTTRWHCCVVVCGWHHTPIRSALLSASWETQVERRLSQALRPPSASVLVSCVLR